MPALTRNEVSDCSNPKLDVYTNDSYGVPTNVAQLEFQIFEKVTDPNNPIQVYPLSGRQSVNLNACPVGDRVETGRYVARYVVPASAPLGTHEIRWFVKATVGSQEQYFNEEFQVNSEIVLTAGQQYVSIAEVRAAGLNANPPDDAAIQASICTWQPFIERATRQWFYPLTLELYVDGNDSDTLFFGVPIISIETLKINDDTVALNTDYYKVYNASVYPMDKQNPRIKLIDSWNDYRDIYTAPMRTGRTLFRKGRQNQYVKGVFGYLDNGVCPALIKRALIKLVIEKLTNPIVPGTGGITPPPVMGGQIIEEWVDGHKRKWADTSTRKTYGLSGITSDQEILDILRLYRAPIGLATPADWSYR